MFNYRKINITYDQNNIVGDINSPYEVTSTLMLHGSGLASSRNRFLKIRNDLLNQNLTSLSFDFIGHGETGGDIKTSSLLNRFEQASLFLNSSYIKAPYNIIGSSMSGYIAIKLLENFQIHNLILIVPAVYHRDAFNLRFNDGFTDLIRKNRSWEMTDAWQILENYKGNLLIISAEYDQVIPAEIINNIYLFAKNVNYKEIVKIGGSDHSILNYINEKNLSSFITQKIIDCLNK